MFVAHAPLSYLVNEKVQKKKIAGLKPAQEIFIVIASLVFGLLPDLDFIVMMMTSRPSYSHHDVFTHTPFFLLCVWLVVFVIVKLTYRFFNKKSKQFFTKDLINILL
jgi:hypothetical protein